jgi:sensor histidine kinase YesM
MAIIKKRLLYHIKTTAIAALIGFPTGLIFCDVCRSNVELMIKVGLFMSAVWIIMWKGNEFVSEFLDHRISWMQEPGKRLLAGMVGHLVYPVVAMTAVNYFVYIMFGWNEDILTLKGMLGYSIPAVLITFFISTFLTAREFFLAWRQSAINEEKMKAEVIASKYETLKNQVNPHFLFNSLNVLTSLVYKDPDLSAKFIKELSNVYRYVLEVKDKELVDIEEELEFLDSFTFLIKMRHSEGFRINIDIPNKAGIKVAPLALQMLVENAIKHNVISTQEPLIIDINVENGYLKVKNNLQKKSLRETSSSHVGLGNIKARYSFLSERPVIIEESNNSFEVKIPTLKVV